MAVSVLADDASPKADALTNTVDPVDVADQKLKFLRAAGKTGELDKNGFETDRKTGGGLVLPFEKWETAVAFDKNKNGTLDWFEFEAYRQAMRKAVLAACDKNKDNQLTGDERTAALKLLADGKPVIKPETERDRAGARPPQAGPADTNGAAAASQPASQPASRPSPQDFHAAINELAGKGVTRENNAAVALYEVIGLPYGELDQISDENGNIIDTKMPQAQVAERLGLAIDCGKPLPNLREELGEEVMETMLAGPWKASDAPNAARRLAEMGDTLDAAAKALQRPQWFSPWAVGVGYNPDDMPMLLMPDYSRLRSLGKYFIARGFYNQGEGNGPDAWRDLQSASRLGTLVGQDPSVIGALVSAAITSLADGATQRMAMHTTDRAILQAMLDNVSNRPAVDIFRSLEGERIEWNRILAGVMRNPEKDPWFFDEMEWSPTYESESETERARERVLEAVRQADPEAVLRAYNRNFDERNDILRMEDRQKMSAASDAFDKRQEETQAKLRGQPPALNASPQDKTQWVADMAAAGITLSAGTLRDKVVDRFEQNRRITMVAVALEMYKLDQGKYPERLDALSPTYLPAVPTDLFNGGKAMIYKPHGATYDLYSVGPDGKNDGSDLRFAGETTRMQTEAKAKAANASKP